MSIRVAFVSKQLSRNPMDGVAVYSANIISELRKLGVTVYEVWPGATFTGKWPIYNLHALKYIVNLLKEKKLTLYMVMQLMVFSCLPWKAFPTFSRYIRY